MIKLQRFATNPLLTPSELPWENMLVFNPGATIVDDKVYMLYRAMGKNDVRSRLGLAISTDGIHFERKSSPIYYGDGYPDESLGIEDPRIVNIEDTYYITYTAVSEDLSGTVNPTWVEHIVKKPRIALATTKDFTTFIDHDVIIPHIAGKNASLFPKTIQGNFWLLYRVGTGKTYCAHSPGLTNWQQEETALFEERSGFWDSKRTGIGSPPIETPKGWLLFYHGVDDKDIYRLGIMFLDLNDPRKILYRSPEPIFEPEADYEKEGFVPNVVFTCGAVEVNGMYYVYYGAADQTIAGAMIEKEAVLNLL